MVTLVLHILSIMVGASICVLQWRSRDRSFTHQHKQIGKYFSHVTLITVITGVILSIQRNEHILTTTTLLYGGWYTLSRTMRAINAAKHGNIVRHKENVLIIYGLFISAVTTRIGLLLFPLILNQPYAELAALWGMTAITLYMTRQIFKHYFLDRRETIVSNAKKPKIRAHETTRLPQHRRFRH